MKTPHENNVSWCFGCRTCNWQSAAQSYLARIGLAEYRADLASHLKAGRQKRTHRYRPSEYMRSLIGALGQNNEELFNGVKLHQGYASEVGV